MKLEFRADMSAVVPEDATVRRELHVLTPNQEVVLGLSPTDQAVLFNTDPNPGQTGSAFLVDYDQANNASTPSAAVSFDLTPPDTTGPTQPQILSINFVRVIPDEPGPSTFGVSPRVNRNPKVIRRS